MKNKLTLHDFIRLQENFLTRFTEYYNNGLKHEREPWPAVMSYADWMEVFKKYAFEDVEMVNLQKIQTKDEDDYNDVRDLIESQYDCFLDAHGYENFSVQQIANQSGLEDIDYVRDLILKLMNDSSVCYFRKRPRKIDGFTFVKPINKVKT